MRFIAAVAAAVAVGVCADPLVGSDADGNLHINATLGRKVFIAGVDILQRVSDLEASQRDHQHAVGNMSAALDQLRAELRVIVNGLTEAPSTPPTSASPTAAPSGSPSAAPSGSPSGSPTITWQITRHAGTGSSYLRRPSATADAVRYAVYKFTETANNASVRAFTVSSGSRRAEVLIVGGGGSGGDGNAPGGGGGGGIVAIGNITLRPGHYFVAVGAGGYWDPQDSWFSEAYDKPGFCGRPSVLRTPDNGLVVAHGGAGGNGHDGPYPCNARTRAACTGVEGGSGGSGPSNNALCPSHTSVTSNEPMDWRPDNVAAWDPSSSTTSVNMTYFYHNGAHSGGSSSLGGGGGGAGGHASGGRGGAGKAFNFDGAGVVYYGAGGGGAGGGNGGTDTGGNGDRANGNAVQNTGSGGGGRFDSHYGEGRGGGGVIMIRFVE